LLTPEWSPTKNNTDSATDTFSAWVTDGTGRIAWARQLSRRIEQPMLAFEQHATVLKTDQAQTLIKNYNKLSKVLLEYELLYHRAWLRQV